jgi:GT2 family glycosyltransferase
MTGNCVGNIRQYCPDATLIVVDNGSTVKDKDKPFTYYADKYIYDDKSNGYGYAINRGIEQAETEYVAVVSNDVLVYRWWGNTLIDCLGIDGCDLVCPTPMYGYPHARYREAIKGVVPGKDLPAYTGLDYWKDRDLKDSLQDAMDFSSFMTTKKVWDDVGGFDEAFINGYSEDVDWKWRAMQKGYHVKRTEAVNTTHIIAATTYTIPETAEQMTKNREYLYKKWDVNESGEPKFIWEKKSQPSRL